jgi:hypothetical protein
MASTTVTGRELATAAFEDLESFFFHSSKFSVRREFDQGIQTPAKIIGSGDSTRIQLSNDLCNHEHDSLSDLMFTMLVVCHELAHYLNFHNHHRDRDRADTVAIEARADNYGAQIFATLITFGKRTKSVTRRLTPDLNQKILTENIGTAIGRLYTDLYAPNPSPSYPNPAHRAAATMAGLLSFFNRYFGYLPETWTIWFTGTIVQKSGIAERTRLEDAANGSEEIFQRIQEIHQPLQESEPLMRHGVKPPFGLFLYSNFQQTPEERSTHQARLTSMIEEFDIFNPNATA